MTATPPLPHSTRSLLAPEDAYLTRSTADLDTTHSSHRHSLHSQPNEQGSHSSHPDARTSRTGRSRSSHHQHHHHHRRKPHTWKKLLWVRQDYPDNYTDELTFLDALQRNPRLRPYEFWPLVADSTVIVQQVCTMIVFVCCFSEIVQQRVSPVSVSAVGTLGAVAGWVLWDYWVGQEEVGERREMEMEREREREKAAEEGAGEEGAEAVSVNGSTTSLTGNGKEGLGLKLHAPTPVHAPTPRRGHSRQSSSGSLRFGTGNYGMSSLRDLQRDSPLQSLNLSQPTMQKAGEAAPAARPVPSTRSQQRIATAKSSVLICGALLGLSPILKSLTKSTASDSIWAMAFWLMLINVIFFDYGGGVGATFPASLSTNAALMASTVLASRLAITPTSAKDTAPTDAQSTAHVFSLTLFSIEVFGLFPVFRRYLRHISWGGHLMLTWFLVMGAGAGVTMILSGGNLVAAIVGAILGSLLTGLAMGICAWWLIGLQRYKNDIHGPWDPARPIIRRWD